MALHQEAIKFSNISATTAVFPITLGGYYDVEAVGTWNAGSAKLEILGPDGATFVEFDSTNTSFTANGRHAVLLPPGTYKWVIVTVTAVYLTIARISIE